jgi:hypothetical protein
MSDTVSIRITADTSGVEAGIQQVRGDLGELKSTVQAAADSMSGGFAGMRGAVERSAQSMDALTASMHGLRPQEIVGGLNEVTAALRHNSAALQEMATKSGEGKSGFGKLVEGIKGAKDIAGDLYSAGKQAVEAIVAMGESSEKVSMLSKQLGMSTHQVQLLQGMAKATGTDFTKLSQSTAALDKNFSKSPDTFKKLGIDIKAGSDQMTILTTVADKFAKTADGPQKTAMAIKLMGQAGAEAIPFLNQGGAAISTLAQKTESYGAANDRAIERGTKLGESVNEAQLAWTGMGNVLTDALAPVLTDIVNSFTGLVKGCIDSYNSGGTVATIFQVIVTVVKNLGVEIDAVAGIFKALWDAVVDIVGALVSDISDAFGVKTPNATQMAETALNLFKDAWQILKDSVIIVIEVIKAAIILFIDRLTMMGAIARDVFTLNWGAIEGDWQSGLDRIQKHATETAAKIKAVYADLAKTVAAAANGQAVPGPAPAGRIAHVPGTDGKTDGNGGGNRQTTGGGGGTRQAASGGNASKASSVSDEKAKSAGQADGQIVASASKTALELGKIDDKTIQELEKDQQERVDAAQKTGEFLVQLGVKTQGQLLQDEIKTERARAQVEAKFFADQEALYAKDAAASDALEKKRVAAVNASETKITELKRKAELQRTQLTRQAINQVASSWGSAVGKMVTLQQGFGATIKNMWQSVQQAIGDAVAKIIENWLAKEITALAVKLGLIKTQSANTIAAEAASAGAGGTASMAAAPFPMNLSAIPFGQAMSAAALSYGTMAALNVGAYDLSGDGIAMLHKGETVIPADQAGGWRNVMGLFASMPNFAVPTLGFGSAANSNAPAAANDSPSAGGYHYHDHSARGLSESQIIANRNAFAKAMKMAHREGKLGFSLPG